MFANLKKKLEEEVGDLTKLASPMNLAGALDRRVGSTQGTNTPNLGSRQSSVASLIDTVTSTPNSQSREKSLSRSGADSGDDSVHVKKVNNEWKAKLETMKKSYEEKLQNQEADFAYLVAERNKILADVKNERDRLSEQLKVVEDKFIRVSTDLEQFEGFSRQENAKVKHLLLNTQSELQASNVRIAELESKLKNNRDDYVREENNKLAFQENEIVSLRKELDAIKLNSEQNSTREVTKFTQEIGALKIELDHFKSLTSKLQEEKNAALKLSDVVAQDKHRLEESISARDQSLDSLQTELENSKSQITKLEESLSTRDQSVKSLQVELNNTKSQLSEKEKQENKMVIQLEEIKVLKGYSEDELKNTVDKNANLLSELQKSQLQLEDAHVRIAEVQSQLNYRSNDQEREENHIDKLASKLASKENEIVSLRKELDAIKLNSEQNSTREVTKFTQEIGALKNELDHVKNLTSKYQEEKNQALKRFEDVAQDKCRLEESISARDQSLNSLQTELENNKSRLSKMEQEKNDVLMQLEELTNVKGQSGTLQAELENTKTQFSKFKQERDNLQSELENTKSQLSKFKQEKDRLQGELENTKSHFAKLKQENDRLQGELENNKSHFSKLKQEKEHLDAESENIKSQLLKFKQETDRLHVELENSKSQTTKLEESLSTRDQSAKSLQVELNNTKSQLSELEKQEDKMVMQLEELKALKGHSDGELKVVMDRNTILLAELQSAQSELQDAHVLIAEVESQLTSRDEHVREESNKLAVQENEIVSLRNEIDAIKLNSEQNSVREMTKFTQEIETLKAELDHFKSLTSKLQEEKNHALKMSDDVALDKRRLEESISVRDQTLDSLQAELEDVKNQVAKLEQDKDEVLMQLEELNILKSHSDDELKIVMDRSTDLYSEVTELKKSLRMSRQQVSELKKAVPKEPKNGGVMEEVSLRDHHISLNSSTTTTEPQYSDVNFQYLRSVLFKYLTASDPQVAANLIRVVATLLELKPEEEVLLRETQESQRSWFNSLITKK